MWDLLGPGLEPLSPALAGGFLTTASPGKSSDSQFLKVIVTIRYWLYSPCCTIYPCSLFYLFTFDRTAQHVGSQFPNQGSNPCPLQWKHGVLTTGPPGKSLQFILYLIVCTSYSSTPVRCLPTSFSPLVSTRL